ncbi:hypothetical protein GOODEAATRI_022501 [Goodea atripinnis]|uniref:Uncharacterized protein n=1 Tax=Goodea atripinnis TaxID=208336 RepID=A0ABV0NQR3_9TELE
MSVPGEIRVPKKPVSSVQRSELSDLWSYNAPRCKASGVLTFPSHDVHLCPRHREAVAVMHLLFPSLSKSQSPLIILAKPGMKSALLSELFVWKMFELLVLRGVHKSKKFHYCKVVFMRHVVQMNRLHKRSSY